jgi:hypothetical protein
MGRAVAALMELQPGRAGRTPPDSDFGRAARLLAGEGITVVVAGPADVVLRDDRAEVSGWVPDVQTWRRVGPLPLHGVFNRLPARHPQRHAPLLAGLAARGVAVGNPPEVNRLALDKAASLRELAAAGLPVPEVEEDPGRFVDRLAEWGGAFLKPRFGSFGRGVRFVQPGDDLASPDRGDGDPILQAAVRPPDGPWRGLCVRGFLQRDHDGAWRSSGHVARVGRDDPVANVARGAEAWPLSRLIEALPAAGELALRLAPLEAGVAAHLERSAVGSPGTVIEVGMDWVLDTDGLPHLIEINGKPGGRLGALAEMPGGEGERWLARHRRALAAPFRTLAYMTSSGPADS